MFRKPRENATSTVYTPQKPSTGRPPTPPSFTSYSDQLNTINASSTMASSTMPLLGRSRTLPRSTGRTNASPIATTGKAKGKSNGSILSFFKKAESSQQANGNGGGNGSLFFGGDNFHGSLSRPRSPTPDDLYDDPLELVRQSSSTSQTLNQDLEGSRYYESGTSIKRRKIDSASSIGDSGHIAEGNNEPKVHERTGRPLLADGEGVILKEEGCTPPPMDFEEPSFGLSEHGPSTGTDKHTEPDPSTGIISGAVAREDKRKLGPFIEDSDSEEDVQNTLKDNGGAQDPDLEAEKVAGIVASGVHEAEQSDEENAQALISLKVPMLKQESTSVFGGDAFDGIEDFGDDEFAEEGEEFIERRWIEEQRRLELGLEDEGHGGLAEGSMEGPTGDEWGGQMELAASCPICAVDLTGITDAVRSYVYTCLMIRLMLCRKRLSMSTTVWMGIRLLFQIV